MPFKDTPEGTTRYCTHTDDNSICARCLGKIDWWDYKEEESLKEKILSLKKKEEHAEECLSHSSEYCDCNDKQLAESYNQALEDVIKLR